MNNRRKLLVALGAAALTPQIVCAQSRQAPVLIAWLSTASREADAIRLVVFKQELASLGWVEGRQVIFEERWAEGRSDRLPLLAEELKARKPAIVVTAPLTATVAASKAFPNTPVVQASGSPPLGAGLAASLARPGGMVTGLSNIGAEISEKSLELLLAAVPNLKRVGFLIDSTSLNRVRYVEMANFTARRHSIEARIAEAAGPEVLESAISRLAKEGTQALIVLPSNWFTGARQRIVNLALAQRWPVAGTSLEWAEHGAILSYGVDIASNFRRAAHYVDKILKGAKPGDLPIEQPTKLELIANLKAAKALGLTIPQPFLMRADRVIE